MCAEHVNHVRKDEGGQIDERTIEQEDDSRKRWYSLSFWFSVGVIVSFSPCSIFIQTSMVLGMSRMKAETGTCFSSFLFFCYLFYAHFFVCVCVCAVGIHGSSWFSVGVIVSF